MHSSPGSSAIRFAVLVLGVRGACVGAGARGAGRCVELLVHVLVCVLV